MDNKKEFYNVLSQTNRVALASSVGDAPHVRIVSFCYDQEKEGMIYFATACTSNKVKEFEQNNKVAITTIPNDPEDNKHIISNNATVKKSTKTIHELKDVFIEQIPSYKEAIDYIGDQLHVYEIEIHEATVILDFENVFTINF